jgi:hypothetical protein
MIPSRTRTTSSASLKFNTPLLLRSRSKTPECRCSASLATQRISPSCAHVSASSTIAPRSGGSFVCRPAAFLLERSSDLSHRRAVRCLRARCPRGLRRQRVREGVAIVSVVCCPHRRSLPLRPLVRPPQRPCAARRREGRRADAPAARGRTAARILRGGCSTPWEETLAGHELRCRRAHPAWPVRLTAARGAVPQRDERPRPTLTHLPVRCVS